MLTGSKGSPDKRTCISLAVYRRQLGISYLLERSADIDAYGSLTDLRIICARGSTCSRPPKWALPSLGLGLRPRSKLSRRRCYPTPLLGFMIGARLRFVPAKGDSRYRVQTTEISCTMRDKCAQTSAKSVAFMI